MDVIPLILSEAEASILSDGVLSMIAECSTECIQAKITKYLNSEERDKEVAAKVADAYGDVLRLKEYLQDEELKSSVDNIRDLTYEDIEPSLSIEALKQLRENIQSILDNKYAIPYIKPVRSSLLKEVLQQMYDSGEVVATIVADRIHKYSYLFKDPPSASYKGTIVKKIVRDRTKYEILVRGIEFLIKQKEKDVYPSQWRLL